ncbi:MAG: phycobilisome linker polypeptide [Cyanobacteria bacterium J06621_11]
MESAPAGQLGVKRFNEVVPVEWVPGLSDDEAEAIISAVYRQVLGNAYVMESERLIIVESQFKRGQLSVRDFVRAVAKSDLYRDRFFTSCPRYRAIELNFRHLLGRAPSDLEEMRAHSTLLDTQGFEADIDSYLDSDEYQTAFGQDFVPYIRGHQSENCQSMSQFTHTFELVRGPSSSSLKGDIAGKRPKLNSLVIQSTPKPVISAAGAGAAFREPERSARKRLGNPGAGTTEQGKTYRIEVTGYQAKTLRKTSRLRRSNRVYLVSFSELSATYQKIHREGGKIASITQV